MNSLSMDLGLLCAVAWCALATAELAGPPAAGADRVRGAGPASWRDAVWGRGVEAAVWRQPTSPAAGPRGLLSADDSLLEALAGARGRNRLVVCGGTRVRGPPGAPLPQRCPAVLWRGRWALARASCVVGLSLADMRLFRTENHERTCDAYDHDPVRMSRRARRAASGRVLPRWDAGGRWDAALLELDRAYPSEDPLANATLADYHYDIIKCWMENIDSEYRYKIEALRQLKGASLYTLLVTGLLPALVLFLFFLFVTFGTGAPLRAPYANDKEGIKTPWMLETYPSDVKCFPTYGQV